MAKKQILHTENNLQIKLIGICSQEFDYKLCFQLNKFLNLDLLRVEDIEIFYSKQNINGSYASYFFEDEDYYIDYMLISNHHPAGDLIPESEKFDYLLRLSGEVQYLDLKPLIKKIRDIEEVVYTTEIDVAKLKSKNNLIF